MTPQKIHPFKGNRCISQQRTKITFTDNKDFGMIVKGWLILVSFENLFSSKLVTLTNTYNLFRRRHFTSLLLFKTQKNPTQLWFSIKVGFPPPPVCKAYSRTQQHRGEVKEWQRRTRASARQVSTRICCLYHISLNIYIWIMSLLISMIVHDLVFVDISYYLFHFFWNMSCILININIVVSFHYFFKNANKFKTWLIDFWSLKRLQINKIGGK